MATIEDGYNNLRAFIVTAAHTAWSNIRVISTDDERSRAAPYARVLLSGPIEMRQVTPTTDEATFTFSILGVWALSAATATEELRIEYANNLRLGLLASAHPIADSHQPMVTQLLGDAMGEAGDGEFEVLVTFQCNVRVTRA